MKWDNTHGEHCKCGGEYGKQPTWEEKVTFQLGLKDKQEFFSWRIKRGAFQVGQD